MTLVAGEVSFHSGWTFHQAAGNGTDAPREVFTIIFMDKDMIMAEPINHNQRLDHDRSVNLRVHLSLKALNPFPLLQQYLQAVWFGVSLCSKMQVAARGDAREGV